MAIRIAITGGSGFIGTNMVQFYIDKGIELINIDKSEPINKEHGKYWRKVDILDLEELKKSISDFSPTHIIHLSARTDLNEKRDIEGYAVNIRGVENIIEAINSYGKVKRSIFSSSMLVCKKGYVPKNFEDYSPTTLYGKSKVLGEKIVRRAKDVLFEWVIVRPISIWGPWFREPYKDFFDMVIKGRYFHSRSISSKSNFGYVKNTVYQIDKLLFSESYKVNRQTFYLGDYVPLNISEWADEIAKVLGKKPCYHVPLGFFKAAALAGDFLKMFGFNRFPMTGFRLKNMMEDNIIDLSNIRKIAPLMPYSLNQGIKETLKWMEARQ